MDRPPFITFLTDYGLGGGYVAACEAVIARLAPAARVLHLGHQVPLGSVWDAARILARVAPWGPVGVHLAVVDPGVGTSRRALAIETGRGDRLVGPDNGLLVSAADALGGAVAVWTLDADRVHARADHDRGLSHTFHGRDLFAPAAALLALGVPPADLGDPADPASLVPLRPPLLERSPLLVRTEVIEVDGFGNVGLSLPMSEYDFVCEALDVHVEGEAEEPWTARCVHTFSELRSGELGLMTDSWGQAQLALNGASAAELLGAELRTVVRLVPSALSYPVGSA